MILPVNHGNARVGMMQSSGSLQAPEASAYDDDARQNG